MLIRWLLTLVLPATVHAPAFCQSWSAVGAGVDGPVYSLAVYGDHLYVGGMFTTAGDVPAAHVARWDGGAWSALGTGTNGAVYALLVHNGELYVGGNFTDCGGTPCSSVARWDGTQWIPVGSGLNGPVYTMAEYQSTLHIGGDFSRVGGRPVHRVAAWDGKEWQEVSGGMQQAVYAMKVTDAGDLYADLYIGGSFVQQDLVRIAWYHPAYRTWLAPVWGGFNAPVYAFANYVGGLVVGGGFTSTASGSRVSRLALRGVDFNGGADGDVYALHTDGVELYVGGLFGTVGPTPGVPASNIVKWSGGGWEALGSGTNKAVRTLMTFRGQLYAGGEFDSADGIRVNHLARWSMTTGVTPAPETGPAVVTVLEIYPNPFNPTTDVRFELSLASDIRLSVLDVTGREVSLLASGRWEAGVHEAKFEGAGRASGVYLCRLQAGSHVLTRKLLLLR